MPIVSVVVQNTRRRAAAAAVDAVLGGVRARIYMSHATGEPPLPDGHPRFPLWLLLRFVGSALLWRVLREHRRSAFFAADSLEPIAPAEMRGRAGASD